MAPARARIEAWLADASRRHGVETCVVVWDGRGGGARARSTPPLDVRYTGKNQTADDRLIELCRGRFGATAAETWVVSSDRDVQGPVRQLGFTVLGAMTFYRKWERGPESGGRGKRPEGAPRRDGSHEKPEPSRGEVEEWLEAFLGESGRATENDEKTPGP